MKNSISDLDLLEGYLFGNLDEASKLNLEKRLESDVTLKADLDDLRILTSGIRINHLNTKLQLLKEIESGDSTHDKGAKEIVKVHNSLWLWLIISLVLFIIAFFTYKYLAVDDDNIPIEYAQVFKEHFDNELILHKTVRAVDQVDSLSVNQRRAYEMYSLQLFSEATPLLKTLWDMDRDTLALLYQGVSEIGMGNQAEGLEILSRSELKKYQTQINFITNR